MMGVRFNSVHVDNTHECSICFQPGDPPYVQHDNCQVIHKDCAKRMVQANKDGRCGFCKQAVDLTSLLSDQEIRERTEQLIAESTIDEQDQITDDARLARQLADEWNAPGFFPDTSGDVGMARALQEQESSICNSNSFVLAGVLTVAIMIASVAGEYFI